MFTTEQFLSRAYDFSVQLCRWMNSFPVREVHLKSEDQDSWFETRNDKSFIFLGDKTRNTIGHEFGHSIFDAVYWKSGLVPDISNIKEECSSWGTNEHYVSARLDTKCRRFGINRHIMTPVADVVGMCLGIRIPEYECHDADYASGFDGEYGEGKPNYIYEDEFFASICGLVHEGCWVGLVALYEMYPEAIESCFAIMDKAMELLDEALRKMREEFFNTPYTFSIILIPIHILVHLHLIMKMPCPE